MKIVISQKNLKKSLGIVEKVVSKNTSLPILNNILLKTENGRLKISATNLEIGVTCFVGAKIEEIGEIAVPARIISDLVNNIVDEKISLVTKNNTLTINSDKYKTQILGLDPKDFPIIPKIKEGVFSKISSKTLKTSLLTVMDSIAASETRPELGGVFINFSNNKIVLAATDSFRLTEKIIDFKNNHDHSIILPRNTVVELIRIAGDMEGDLNINLNDNQIAFSNDEFELISRLVDGNYPDYKKVIPEKSISRALVKSSDLEKGIKLAGLFSSTISDIKLNCQKNEIIVSAKNSDKGEVEASIEATLKNDPFEVSLNYHYLSDGLKALNEDKVVIEFTGTGSPLVLRPNNDNKDIVYLIMPLRQ